ncbi:MAG: hypothetical protein ACKVU0_18005 [Saprospiraceae bacterium]
MIQSPAFIPSGIGNSFSPGPLLRSIEELDQNSIKPETVWRVPEARIVYANYALLQHDFPQLQDPVLEKKYPLLTSLKGKAREEAIRGKVDDWLLRHTAFISESQANQTEVNTPIKIGTEKVQAYRPPRYGRALVFSVQETENGLSLKERPAIQELENRLLDVKGTGVAPTVKPQNVSHRNGINRLGFALYELVMQELLERVFRHSDSQVQTLPIYGILDLGFDELGHNKHHGSPVGLLIRRAHRRTKPSGGLFPYGSTGQLVQLSIEQLLRRYGITSVNEVTRVQVWREDGIFRIRYGEQDINFFNAKQRAEIERVSHHKAGNEALCFDGINIQHTRDIGLNPTRATLVDFQSYSVQENFEHPILSLVSNKLLRWGGSIWPGSNGFVQPDPALRIPFQLLGDTGSILGYDLGENKIKLDSLCYGLATDFRSNQISRENLLETLQSYLGELTAHWGA